MHWHVSEVFRPYRLKLFATQFAERAINQSGVVRSFKVESIARILPLVVRVQNHCFGAVDGAAGRVHQVRLNYHSNGGSWFLTHTLVCSFLARFETTAGILSNLRSTR